MKTAIVYDYLPALGGGAERALLEIASHFEPDVELYFGFVVDSPYSRNYLKALRSKYGQERIHCGPTIKYAIPILFRVMNFLLPAFLHSLNLQKYDLVFTYTAFIAHAIVPPEKGRHIAYINTPARFLWNLTHSQSTLKTMLSPLLITDVMRFRSQLYDMDGIYHVDKILAISAATAQRITTFYNLASDILYPPSVPDSLLKTHYLNPEIRNELGDYFTHVSRVESYKNIDLVIKTATENNFSEKIIIMGDGPYLNNLKQFLVLKNYNKEVITLTSLGIEVEKYGNILFTGYIEEAKKMQILANASASFSLNDEDFGITKIESLAVGTPVIGFAAGATPEIIIHKQNGILFYENSSASLVQAIAEHKKVTYNRSNIINSAKPFTISAFHTNLDKVLHERVR